MVPLTDAFFRYTNHAYLEFAFLVGALLELSCIMSSSKQTRDKTMRKTTLAVLLKSIAFGTTAGDYEHTPICDVSWDTIKLNQTGTSLDYKERLV